MLERVDQGRGGGMFWRMIWKRSSRTLNRSLTKHGYGWRAQIIRKTSDLCEHGNKIVNWEERERERYFCNIQDNNYNVNDYRINDIVISIKETVLNAYRYELYRMFTFKIYTYMRLWVSASHEPVSKARVCCHKGMTHCDIMIRCRISTQIKKCKQISA